MKKFLEFGTPERTAFTKKVTPGEMPNGKFQKADHVKKKDVDERVMSTPQKVTQMQHYWDDLDHIATDERKKKSMETRFGIKNIKFNQKGKIVSFEEDRDYKDEYKKFQSSKKMIKYRAELVKYNRDKGTYGNGDGKDASHKNGKIVGMEDESTNRGRAEKSRLVGSKRK